MTDKKDSSKAKIAELKKARPAKEVDDYFSRLPKFYFDCSDLADIHTHIDIVGQIESGARQSAELISDIEKFIILKNDTPLLLKSVLQAIGESREQTSLLRIYRDRRNKFFIAAFYDRLGSSARKQDKYLKEPDWDWPDLDKDKKYRHDRIVVEPVGHGSAELKLQVRNIAYSTLLQNLLETLESYPYGFIEVWKKRDASKKDTFIMGKLGFFEPLSKEQIESIRQDFRRYIQTFINKRSLFDIVGPSMIGPSSSHTAGANRIGQVARNLFLGLKRADPKARIKGIKIVLVGSFLETGVGHNTPEAIIGGLSGQDTDAPMMIGLGREAIEKRDRFIFNIGDDKPPFLGFEKPTEQIAGLYANEADNNTNIAEVIAVTDKDPVVVTGFSIGGGNIEVRYINRTKLSTPIDGKKLVTLDPVSLQTLPDGKPGVEVEPVIRIGGKAGTPKEGPLTFHTLEELLKELGREAKGDTIVAKIIGFEKNITGASEEAINAQMRRFWKVMKDSVAAGLANRKLSKLGLTGQDAAKLSKYREAGSIVLSGDNIYALSLRYAIAVNEYNATNGLIVACPTGGSCGILPGILKAWQEIRQDLPEESRENAALGALFVAGFLGMVLFDDVPTAGATLGCQAEIGGGAAMAAAALAFLEGGTLDQIIESFTLALKNCMGLVCDPVAGLVEIPCVKRNGIYSSVAISSAAMGMAGIKSVISPDEVILAVKEVGQRLHDDYKETARAGLAKTRDGKKIEMRMQEEVDRLFEN
jgi:L-serine dehydratase